MRDGQIFAMQEASARRSGLLLGQFSFLETRQRAFEIVCKSSTFRQRLAYFFSPASFIEAVDALQLTLLEQERAKMVAAQEKAKEKAMKPKLTIVGVNGHVSEAKVG